MTQLQADIQALMARAIDDGERALQFAAYLDGELIVDARAAAPDAGLRDDSLFPFFSTGKGIAATAMHILAERGCFSYDDPVAKYWPEFAANGKGNILIRHLLNHTAGLPNLPEHGDFATVADWDAMCAFFAAEKPLHPPGAQQHYHAISYGWLLGETARRATGRDMGEIIRTEICKPLHIDNELFFGVPESVLHRCLTCEKELPKPPAPNAAPPPPPDPNAPVIRNIPAWVCPLEDWINDDRVRRGCLPASNGFGTARALARHSAALIGNGIDGVRLISDATRAEALKWHDNLPGHHPLGYNYRGPADNPAIIFGNAGHGGSFGLADLRTNLAVGFVKSRMHGDLGSRLIDTLNRHIYG